jgi:2-polyprenyl-3-methyl-5-hydroxy-6-metoxy-1,4-benzoquinol methylase
MQFVYFRRSVGAASTRDPRMNSPSRRRAVGAAALPPEQVEQNATLEIERSTGEGPSGPPAFDYSTIPPGHYDLVFHRRRGIQSKWHHLKFARVVGHLSGRRRVLDVGCGPGTLLGMLDEEQEAVGVDITSQQIDYAREAYGGPRRSFHACALQELPTEIEPFDAVTAVELIEHLPPDHLDSTLRCAIDRLRPGGKLVLTTPNYRSAWPLVERLVDRLGEVQYYVQHINKFTRPRLRALLEDLGLREVKVNAYLAFAPFSAILGWRFADLVGRIEAGPIENRLGLIMIATGIKQE